MITIDLRGPDGNAFALLVYARQFGKQLDWSSDKINEVLDDMTSGNYEHLLDVFKHNFSDFTTFET